MSNTSYIILHRNSSTERQNNLSAILQYLTTHSPKLEIIVVEQDATPSNFYFPSSVKHVFLYNPGPFNRSWGFNVGFKNASNDIIAFGDNDLIVSEQALIDSYNACREFPTVNPYKAVIELTQSATHEILASKSIPPRFDGKPRAGITYSGGLIFMTREAIQTVGGWDERLWGWGAEDDLMTTKINKLLPKTLSLNYNALHLWHPISPATHTTDYKNNVAIYKEILKMPAHQLRTLCKTQFQSIGNPSLYNIIRAKK